ncbi:MAG: 1,4-alpha-glucan branching enzyme GlgB [Candidatus Anoxychlamydiales bacterium]|nr:1,4-alpha-glucan branching enzyme GlgB [Candidatus Anoxychlamydiales bacterium]NGX35852.1 1,4-alpha-glucan branching enzyme GlgB [Candidatus Anoxychlamydiales bacterium]
MEKDLQLLVNKKHTDPHSFLGLHGETIRIFRPKNEKLFIEVKNKKVEAKKVDERGLFIHDLKEKIAHLDYKIYLPNQSTSHDPYTFETLLESEDIERFVRGEHFNLYNILGAHKKNIKGISGIQFSLWAPSAKGVSLVGNFNAWCGKTNPLKNMKDSGIWQIFMPSLDYGELYKFEITTNVDNILIKTDPFAYITELRPHNSSVVFDIDSFLWEDSSWMEKRKKQNLSRAINIYEVHLQSWIKGKDFFINYKELAKRLVPYLKEMGFNYIELMPIMEHPLDDSWGYQVTGFFAITSRYGNPEDFQYFVNLMHKNDIAVILDWVPAHFPIDDFALNKFDGTKLFEHEDPMLGFNPQWKSAVFDYGKKEIQNFLISSALFYIEKYHIDGLRVDAVSSMLYLDFARKEGEWKKNIHGENLNLEAIDFLKRLNQKIGERFSDVLIIAEEATSFKGVSDKKGLGFDLKWNMGWMNDTLKYFKNDIQERSNKQNDLTFSIMYAFHEKFILPFSHDEVVYEKKSLFDKMQGGDLKEKFANLRLLYSYFMCHPGKKLTFMGSELAVLKEWDNFKELDWELLKKPMHKKYYEFVKDINHLYLKKEALFEDDFSFNGFEWVDIADSKNSIISYLRIAKNSKLLCIHNFSKNDLKNYLIKLKNLKKAKIIFSTNLEKYGGDEKDYEAIKKSEDGLYLYITPFSSLIFEVEFV